MQSLLLIDVNKKKRHKINIDCRTSHEQFSKLVEELTNIRVSDQLYFSGFPKTQKFFTESTLVSDLFAPLDCISIESKNTTVTTVLHQNDNIQTPSEYPIERATNEAELIRERLRRFYVQVSKGSKLKINNHSLYSLWLHFQDVAV